MEQSVILLIVVVIVFFLLRELWTWYWKINAIVNQQRTTEKLLRAILSELRKDKEPTKEIKKEIKQEEVDKNEIDDAIDEALNNVKTSRIYVRNKLTGNKKMMPIDEYEGMSDSKKKRWKIID